MPSDRENEQRDQQLERLRETVDRNAEAARAQAEEESIAGAERPQDELDVRTKGSGHKKKTADKWNQ